MASVEVDVTEESEGTRADVRGEGGQSSLSAACSLPSGLPVVCWREAVEQLSSGSHSTGSIFPASDAKHI